MWALAREQIGNMLREENEKSVPYYLSDQMSAYEEVVIWLIRVLVLNIWMTVSTTPDFSVNRERY